MSDLFTVDHIMFFIEIDRSSEPIACTWISPSYFTKSYLEQTRRQVNEVWIRLSCDGLLPWKSRFVLFRFSKWLRTIGQDSVHYYHVNLWRGQWPMLLQRLSFFFHIFTGYRLSRPPANSRAPCFCSHSICFRESPKITVTGRKSKPSGRRHQLKVFFIPKTKPACFLFQLI